MSDSQKYPSAIPLPPTIPRINEKPGIRTYEEIEKETNPLEVEYLRQEAAIWWGRATEGYKNGRSDEEGIRDMICRLDLEKRLNASKLK